MSYVLEMFRAEKTGSSDWVANVFAVSLMSLTSCWVGVRLSI